MSKLGSYVIERLEKGETIEEVIEKGFSDEHKIQIQKA